MIQWWKNAARTTEQKSSKQPAKTPAIMEPAEPRLLLSCDVQVNALDFNALMHNLPPHPAIITGAGPVQARTDSPLSSDPMT